MKEVLSVVLSASLVMTTGCSVQKSSRSHKPATSKPASEQQIQQTEQKINQEGDAQNPAGKNGETSHSQKQAYLDAAMNSLLKSSDMAIKTYEGEDMELAEYKRNPTQGFVLFPKEVGEGYNVLKTAVDLDLFNAVSVIDTDLIAMTYEVFAMDGEMVDFNGEDLEDPIFKDALDVELKNALANKTAVQGLMARINGADLAMTHGSLQMIADFLFPTAYASKKKKLLITAIVFTSIAIISYLFAFYPIGDISTAVAIVFWLLYAFEF